MAAAPDPDALIADRYLPDATATVALAGGLTACAVSDRLNPELRLMAVRGVPGLPPRPAMLPMIDPFPIPHAVMPIAQGPARDPLPGAAGPRAWFTVCPALPGPSLEAGLGGTPWREAELIGCVLLPVVAALTAMQAHRLTHRAIHPGNLFRAGPGAPVVLGPCWAAPPASLQPAAYEPPPSAICLPAGRGEGSIADDIYALGVTLLVLALGAPPAAWADADDLLARKISQGSAAALLGEARLPPLLLELIPGMLAEDPAHRTPLAVLAEPENARGRRLAGRAVPRTGDPLVLGAMAAGSARELAYAMTLEPEAAVQALRSGAVDRWLRRSLADPQLCAAVQEVTGAQNRAGTARPGGVTDAVGRPAAMLVMRAIAVLDPLAPLCWRGLSFWPDGFGPMLATDGPDAAKLEEFVAGEAASQWRQGRADRPDIVLLRQEARDWRARLGGRQNPGGLARLAYSLNPLLPCRSPFLAGQMAARLIDLLPALDAACAADPRGGLPADPHILSFIGERAQERVVSAPTLMAAGLRTPEERLGLLRMFAQIQQALRLAALPHLATRLLESEALGLERWRNRRTRAALLQKLRAAATSGQLGAMLAEIEDPALLQADAAGATAARARLHELQTAMQAIAGRAAARGRASLELGHEIAAALALGAMAFAAFRLALT